MNVGVDFSMFTNRLVGSFGVYNKRTWIWQIKWDYPRKDLVIQRLHLIMGRCVTGDLVTLQGSV
ncbi:MAG: hypothetical protein ACLU4J_24860 [Butyricimonas paravirosa]